VITRHDTGGGSDSVLLADGGYAGDAEGAAGGVELVQHFAVMAP
jgi:hypothetical protein